MLLPFHLPKHLAKHLYLVWHGMVWYDLAQYDVAVNGDFGAQPVQCSLPPFLASGLVGRKKLKRLRENENT